MVELYSRIFPLIPFVRDPPSVGDSLFLGIWQTLATPGEQPMGPISARSACVVISEPSESIGDGC